MQENRSFDSYFGTYPGADGIPAGRVRAGPGERRLRRALPRPVGSQQRRAARHRQRAGRHRQRPDGRLRRPGREGQRLHVGRSELQPVHRDQPAARARTELHRRDGLPRRARDPQLLGLRRELRAPGPHVRAQRVLEPAPAPVHGVRVVGLLHQSARPFQLPRRSSRTPTRTRPSRPAASPPPTTASCTTPGPTSPTCCTSRT